MVNRVLQFMGGERERENSRGRERMGVEEREVAQVALHVDAERQVGGGDHPVTSPH